MKPIVGSVTATKCAKSLSDFIGVMHGNMFFSSSMYVEFFPKILDGHCRAFNMPARESFSPRAIPLHNVIRLVCNPEQKIPWLFFFLINFGPNSSILFFKIEFGEFGVVLEFRSIKYQSCARLVGESLFFDHLYLINFFFYLFFCFALYTL